MIWLAMYMSGTQIGMERNIIVDVEYKSAHTSTNIRHDFAYGREFASDSGPASTCSGINDYN